MSKKRSSRGPVAVGALSGVVAALPMTLVQALLRLGLGVPSPDKRRGPERATGRHRVTALVA